MIVERFLFFLVESNLYDALRYGYVVVSSLMMICRGKVIKV